MTVCRATWTDHSTRARTKNTDADNAVFYSEWASMSWLEVLKRTQLWTMSPTNHQIVLPMHHGLKPVGVVPPGSSAIHCPRVPDSGEPKAVHFRA